MAKVQMMMPDDFLKRLSKLEKHTDEITEAVLKEGAKVVLSNFKSSLNEVIGKDLKYKSRSTGLLVSSLGISKPLMDRNGNFDIKIGFAEPRDGNESNAKIATVIEYGKQGQPPKPFLKPAKTSSKKACVKAMVDTFEQEVKNL
ncbi:MAG: HK97-gp10 family putative phage morphogenesis protein [Ruminococcus sp.]